MRELCLNSAFSHAVGESVCLSFTRFVSVRYLLNRYRMLSNRDIVVDKMAFLY